jgi:hypothetical protein
VEDLRAMALGATTVPYAIQILYIPSVSYIVLYKPSYLFYTYPQSLIFGDLIAMKLRKPLTMISTNNILCIVV